jgi:predicted nuclease of predicted toxin-antitoxin system
LRFLLDENLPVAVADALRAAGHDALVIRDSPHRGATDPELWVLAAREGRIVVTRDIGFVQAGSAPTPAGIVLLRLPMRSRRVVLVDAVRTLLDAVPAEELVGHITVVEPSQVRRRPLTR